MTTPTRRLFLIDGHAFLYRAHYAMLKNPLMTRDGLNASAAFGVARLVRRLLDQHQPDRVAFVMDTGESHRYDLYPEYKAQRASMPDDLRACMPHAVELIEAMGVPVIKAPGWEADDVIGTLAQKGADAGMEVVIVAMDKDFHQLIQPGVRILNPGRGGPSAVEEHWIDDTNAAERLGVPADRTIDYLALVGDSSDNVPGAKGIGPKSAAYLIARYPDIESMIAAADEIGGKRGQALAECADMIRLSRELVTIRKDVPLELTNGTLRPKPADEGALSRILGRLEFASIGREWGIPLGPPAEFSALAQDAALAEETADMEAPKEPSAAEVRKKSQLTLF